MFRELVPHALNKIINVASLAICVCRSAKEKSPRKKDCFFFVFKISIIYVCVHTTLYVSIPPCLIKNRFKKITRTYFLAQNYDHYCNYCDDLNT